MTKNLEKIIAGLSRNYDLRVIDGELCVFRDFRNGFEVEICPAYRTQKRIAESVCVWKDKTQLVNRFGAFSSLVALKVCLQSIERRYGGVAGS